MNIYSGLLFLHGHIADAALARQLIDAEEPAREPGTGTWPAAIEADPGVTASACPAARGAGSGVGR